LIQAGKRTGTCLLNQILAALVIARQRMRKAAQARQESDHVASNVIDRRGQPRFGTRPVGDLASFHRTTAPRLNEVVA
jgi:hypothetical protein